ncbi:polyprotein [Frankliniella fusca]|uniref:Polyprotein n=1 Tax=Frankliniella fusca TaxID=407009 RepID=A0AAE1H9A6_9NEOP|nr:polyprotein [Frankliniella fusca]
MKTPNDTVLLKYFKKYRTIHKQVIKKAKCIYNHRTMLVSENKSRTISSVINNNIGKCKPDHKNLNNPEVMSNIFNDYYINIINDFQKTTLEMAQQ